MSNLTTTQRDGIKAYAYNIKIFAQRMDRAAGYVDLLSLSEIEAMLTQIEHECKCTRKFITEIRTRRD